MATAIGDLVQIMQETTRWTRQIGLRLTYRPQKKLVEARVQPGLHMCERYMSEGGVVPNAHAFTLTTRFLLGQG